MCCLGIIQYQMCEHVRLYKVGCTAGREEGLCRESQQELLLLTTYRWTCEDCYTQRFRNEADTRIELWNERVRLIERDESLTDEAREMRVWALRNREDHEEQLQEDRRLAQVQEMQYAEDWTSQYGQAVYLLRYGCRRRGQLQSQRPERRHAILEEDQRPEQPQLENRVNGGVGGRQQDEQNRLPEQPQLENGVNGGVGERQQDEQDPLPDDREEQPQLENGVNGVVELTALHHRIHELRIRQPWDLVVLRDTLRTSKELRQQREEQRRLIRRDHGSDKASE